MTFYKKLILPQLALGVFLSGCVEISDEYVPYYPDDTLNYIGSTALTVSETSYSPAADAAVVITGVSEPTVTAPTEDTVSESETSLTGNVGTPSEEWDPAFFNDCLFFGDSICRALSVYNDLIDPERVAAAGGCAARNIGEFTFKLNDIDYSYVSAVQDIAPGHVYLWMGMNDINMTEKDEYADNLKSIALTIHSCVPDAVIVIIGITPTASYHEWGANKRIAEFNEAARNMAETSEIPISYIDVTDVLADNSGYLYEECDGGDGMHLSQVAYYRVLSKIYSTLS